MRPVDSPSEVHIRQASRADLLEVLCIEEASFEQPWPYGAFERFLGTPGFLVAGDGEVVGYVVADTVDRHGATVGHIKDLAVAPSHRGRGIGRRLLSRAISTLSVAGAARVKLEVRAGNTAAKSLYRSAGFERHHTIPGYYADGEDAEVMVLSLP